MAGTSLRAIYYLIAGPTRFGGQLVNQEHVVSLRNAGYRVYLLDASKNVQTERHQRSTTALLLHGRMKFNSNDVVVLPEAGREILEFFADKSCIKIIHCQNPFLLFHKFESIQEVNAYGAKAFLSCSSFTTEKLSEYGVRSPIYTVQPAIPSQATSPVKKLQIAYIPRKRPAESIFLRGLFRSLYPMHRNIPWVEIDNLSRSQALEVIAESAVLASMSNIEGLGLPPLEAMAAECLVAGYHGFGGTSYATPDNGFWVEEGRHIDYAHSLARCIDAYSNEARRREIVNAGKLTLSEYSQESFERSLLDSWRRLLGEELDDFLLDTD